MNTGFQRAIDAVGTAAELARLLKISHSAICQWKGKPPLERLPKIEKVTGVPARELRPDFFKKVNK
jgi:DNA-binding transcriptional regulator YdaS (Cro superfamily)